MASRASDIPALVQRLRRGGRQTAQLLALTDLLVAAGRGGHHAIAAAGAVPLLVQHFGGASPALQRAAGKVLAQLCHAEASAAASQEAFMEAGGLPVLLAGLTSRDELVQASCAHVAAQLMRLSGKGGAAMRQALLAADCTAVLVGMLGSSATLQAAAAAAVRYLASDYGAAAERVHQAGGIAALVHCCGSTNPEAVVEATHALGNLSHRSRERKTSLLAAGAVPTLLQLLTSTHARTSAAAVCTLVLLIGEDPTDTLLDALVEAGALAAVASCVSTADQKAAERALAVITRLSRDSPARSSAAMAAGVPQALQTLPQALQQSSSALVQRGVAEALDAINSAAARVPEEPVTATSQPAVGTAAGASASVRRSRAARICAAPGCGAVSGLRFCGGCGKVCYCSQACSRSHWREHRTECRCLRAEQAVGAAVGQRP